ncbi:UDP-glucose dehydrogenase family protein [Desulforhabdus amnigena]|jgi:UDPglucose 6-dehydrogenase|uniref:UDP-glucose 6-dehydrogenase n=1 Tax=Desulforhabdus amnigena TaxID=40218 RepID=A0A9W6FX71_9BACT|nr:UDP-glucose/GDP-mannose dehydrogenase family protein [Desulforhabdus amnigena]GLI36489.1 UDP-glucose 6-dehydrogenase [Desulforhabdus amnigena]
MKIAIIGTGYVGLVSGACFAEFGHEVTCIDKDAEKIARLQRGEIPIYEPGLDQLVHKNISAGRLIFTTEFNPGIPEAQVIFIAVGTPASRRGDGYADLTYVHDAARQLASHLQGYTVIVNKSTVPVGTARQVARIVSEVNPGADFDVASNPEFLREGAAIRDFMHPDRVVIGVDSERAQEVLKAIYRPLYLIETPFVITGIETSELIKYAANAFLATKISFINELANICEEIGADVQDVARGIGLDGRIGKKFLHAGPGYGGSCFPKDTHALLRIAQENGVACRIVESVVEVNSAQKARMARKIRKAVGGNEGGKTIAVLGLAFKPETDDLRDAPALTIISTLLEHGAIIRAHDPQAMKEAARVLDGVTFCSNPYEACEGADAVVLMTEWNEYRALDLKRIKEVMKRPVFVDLRNVYMPRMMAENGFDYYSVGRAAVTGR